jgi:type II secretory pathway component PulJ
MSHRLRRAFSLLETVAALAILALVSFGVLAVVERCTAAMADSQLRMQAFEVARENMEKLLALASVSDKLEYGVSDKYPDIEWQTVVEPFYEPVTKRMWVRAICSAYYKDTDAQLQTVELTHWLTNLTKKQVLDVLKQWQTEEQLLAEADQLIETIAQAIS